MRETMVSTVKQNLSSRQFSFHMRGSKFGQFKNDTMGRAFVNTAERI